MIASLLLGFALADEPPERPQRPERYPSECPSAIGITNGQPFNAIDIDYRATCSGVLLPTSEVYYLQAIKTWADESVAFFEAAAARDALAIAQAEAATRHARRAAWMTAGATACAIAGAIAVSRLTSAEP